MGRGVDGEFLVIVVVAAVLRSLRASHGALVPIGRRLERLSRIVVCDCLVGGLLVAREGDIGRGLEELLPELGAFPDLIAVLRVLFDYWQDTLRDDTMRPREVRVNLL